MTCVESDQTGTTRGRKHASYIGRSQGSGENDLRKFERFIVILLAMAGTALAAPLSLFGFLWALADWLDTATQYSRISIVVSFAVNGLGWIVFLGRIVRSRSRLAL